MCFGRKLETPKIIVFGENHHNTLGLIRSLGEVGLRPYLVLVKSNVLYPFVSKSRYIKKAWGVDNVRDGLDIILSSFGEEESKPLIFPTYDTEVKSLCEHLEVLDKRFVLPTIRDRRWSLQECLNKEFMRTLAQSIGLNTPKSWVVNCAKEVDLPLDITYPCVVKTIDSSSGPKDYNIHKSSASLLESIRKLSECCEIVQIQEFIQKKTEVIFLGWSNGKGTTIIPCLMDKIREYPKNFGTTGLGRVTKNMEEYIQVDKVCEYINVLGYSGLFSVEFLLSNSGEAYFLEVNLRNDGNGYLPTYGGVNLPYQWYLAMTGNQAVLSSLPKRIDRDFIMMREFSDIMIPIKYGYSYWKWIKDFLNVDCFLYWNRKDLLPYWYFLFDKVIRCIKKL